MRKVITLLMVIVLLFSSCNSNKYTHGNTVTIDISEYSDASGWQVCSQYLSNLVSIDSAQGSTERTTAKVDGSNIVLSGLSSGYWLIQVTVTTESSTITGYGVVLVTGDGEAELEFTVTEIETDDNGETGDDGGETGGDEGGTGDEEDTTTSTDASVLIATLNDSSGMNVTPTGTNTWIFSVTLTTSSPAWYVNNVSASGALPDGLTAEVSEDNSSLTLSVDSSKYSSSFVNVSCIEGSTKYYADLILTTGE